MFNVKFTDLKSAMSLNSLTEAQIVSILKQAMENRNYRNQYNRTKSVLIASLKSDPIVQERLKALKAAK